MTCTRKRSFCSLAHVTITLHHFLVLHIGDGAYSGCSSVGWYWGIRLCLGLYLFLVFLVAVFRPSSFVGVFCRLLCSLLDLQATY